MRLIFICLLMLHPSVSIALSCMPTDSVWLYQRVKEDKADYLLIKGTVTLREAANIPERSAVLRKETLTMAHATGEALSQSGFDVPFDRPITIRAVCQGTWCSSPTDVLGETRIFALRSEDDELVLTLGVCGGFTQRWSEEEERRMLDCHLNGECPSLEF